MCSLYIFFCYFDPRRRLNYFIQKSTMGYVGVFYHRIVLYWFNLSSQNSPTFIVRFLAMFFETRNKAGLISVPYSLIGFLILSTKVVLFG